MRAERGAWCVGGLRDLISELPAGIVMAEIGVFAGEASRLFLASDKVVKLYGVDSWRDYRQEDGWHCPFQWGHVRRIFTDWALRQHGRVIPLRMDSAFAAEWFVKDDELDFVYIDACHDYEAVRADIDLWAPKVKPGGFIGGHDYSPAFPGVMRAVSEACARPMTFRDTSWLFRKAE